MIGTIGGNAGAPGAWSEQLGATGQSHDPLCLSGLSCRSDGVSVAAHANGD